jgi:hypothetical protein
MRGDAHRDLRVSAGEQAARRVVIGHDTEEGGRGREAGDDEGVRLLARMPAGHDHQRAAEVEVAGRRGLHEARPGGALPPLRSRLLGWMRSAGQSSAKAPLRAARAGSGRKRNATSSRSGASISIGIRQR